MEIGSCPACARPYTSGEVTGTGILRARPEAQGGPWVEFECPECARRIRLVPHGQGRFAPPGVAPPPPVPPEQRTPPWQDAAGAPRADPSRPGPEPAGAPKAGPSQPPRDPTPTPDAPPISVAEALEVLGVPPTAEREQIERAFRERSVQCHPDKVAHLDAEFVALATRKFRRLREAYEMLTAESWTAPPDRTRTAT